MLAPSKVQNGFFHNGYNYSSVPIDHSISIKKEYKTIILLLKKTEQYWTLIIDLCRSKYSTFSNG